MITSCMGTIDSVPILFFYFREQLCLQLKDLDRKSKNIPLVTEVLPFTSCQLFLSFLFLISFILSLFVCSFLSFITPFIISTLSVSSASICLRPITHSLYMSPHFLHVFLFGHLLSFIYGLKNEPTFIAALYCCLDRSGQVCLHV